MKKLLLILVLAVMCSTAAAKWERIADTALYIQSYESVIQTDTGYRMFLLTDNVANNTSSLSVLEGDCVNNKLVLRFMDMYNKLQGKGKIIGSMDRAELKKNRIYDINLDSGGPNGTMKNLHNTICS
jgi:hypothetical protein